jgi:ribosome-binding factor A
MNFCLGNAMKYVWRADEKHSDGGIEDLNKAKWYIERELQRRIDARNT